MMIDIGNRDAAMMAWNCRDKPSSVATNRCECTNATNLFCLGHIRHFTISENEKDEVVIPVGMTGSELGHVVYYWREISWSKQLDCRQTAAVSLDNAWITPESSSSEFVNMTSGRRN